MKRPTLQIRLTPEQQVQIKQWKKDLGFDTLTSFAMEAMKEMWQRSRGVVK